MKINTAEIKSKVSLIQLMERDGVKMHSVAGMRKCLCPFHNEKSPSCCVYPDEHFYCFGCHASGDVIGYVMLRDGLRFKEAIEKLSGHAPTFMFNPREYVQFEPRRETPPLAGAFEMVLRWIAETDFDDLDLFAFELGVSADSLVKLECAWTKEHNAWAFPMRDSDGRAVGIRLRDKNGKKWAVKGSKEGLFFTPMMHGRTAFIVEGPTDAAAGLTLDLQVIGRPSCQGGVKELVKLLERVNTKEVIIISDNDAPGLAGSERLQSHLTVPFRELVLPCKDLREFLKLGGTRQLLESMAAKQLPQRRPNQ